MRDKVERLQKIKYCLLKERESDFSESQLVSKIQSLYDAAINPDSADMTEFDMPLIALGIPISWSNNNTSINIDSGLFEITDDLTDNKVANIEDQLSPLAFTTNEEFFFVNGEVFELKE